MEQVGDEAILVALAQLVTGKVAHELYAALCGRNVPVTPHDLAGMKPTRDTVDLNDFAVMDAKSKPNVAHAVEACGPLPTDSLVKPIPRAQHRRIDVRDLDENRGLVKVGDADIFLYQAYIASPSLRLLPAIVS